MWMKVASRSKRPRLIVGFFYFFFFLLGVTMASKSVPHAGWFLLVINSFVKLREILLQN